jgi:hypothetical protein
MVKRASFASQRSISHSHVFRSRPCCSRHSACSCIISTQYSINPPRQQITTAPSSMSSTSGPASISKLETQSSGGQSGGSVFNDPELFDQTGLVSLQIHFEKSLIIRKPTWSEWTGHQRNLALNCPRIFRRNEQRNSPKPPPPAPRDFRPARRQRCLLQTRSKAQSARGDMQSVVVAYRCSTMCL